MHTPVRSVCVPVVECKWVIHNMFLWPEVILRYHSYSCTYTLAVRTHVCVCVCLLGAHFRICMYISMWVSHCKCMHACVEYDIQIRHTIRPLAQKPPEPNGFFFSLHFIRIIQRANCLIPICRLVGWLERAAVARTAKFETKKNLVYFFRFQFLSHSIPLIHRNI